MEKINYISHLTEAISRFSDDDRLNSTHVSLYISLFSFWNINRFKNPVSINRSDVMRVSKVGSKTTYHRCINQLDEWGYIEYFPSNNPLKGSLIKMVDFFANEKSKKSNKNNKSNTSPKKGQVQGQLGGQVGGQLLGLVVGQVPGRLVGQVVVSSINSIKHNKHYKLKREGNKNFLSSPSQLKNDKSSFFEKISKDELHSPKKSSRDELNSSSKNDLKSPSTRKRFAPPNLKEVKTFFHENKSSYQVAETFFNHFESNGWLVGGRAKMKNWKAAARNWMMRDEKYQAQNRSPAQQRLHVNENKDYSEPL